MLAGPREKAMTQTADAAVQTGGTPTSPELTRRAVRGAVWMVAGHGGAQVLRLGGNLVLTRVLAREHFGLMALVMVVLYAVNLLSDLGIGPAIVQSKHGDDPTYVDTAWTIQVVRGLVLGAITCLLAWPAAAFYGDPRLTELVLVAALVPIISGSESANRHLQSRHLALGRLVLLDLVSQVGSLVVMLTWALLWPSALALVIGALTRQLVYTILTHLALPGTRSRFCWDRDAARSVARFGRWILLSTALTFLAGYSDRAIFGKLVTLSQLGIYAIALVIAAAPQEAIDRLNGAVIFPLFSRAAQRGDDLQKMYLKARWPVLIVGSWALAGVIAGGPTGVRILYDERYWDAGSMVQILAAGLWFGIVLAGTNGAVLLAHGRPYWLAGGSAAKFLGLLIGIPLGFKWGGILGAIAGLSAAEGCRYLVITYAVRRAGFRIGKQDAVVTLQLVAGAGVGLLAANTTRRYGLPIAAEALAVFLAVTALWLPHLPALRGWRAWRAADS